VPTPKPNWSAANLGKWEWLDVTDPTPDDIRLLGERFPFHPLNLEDCLSRRQLTRVEDHEAYLFIVFHFPSVSKEGRVSRSQLSVFVSSEALVTLHPSSLGDVRGMAQAEGRTPAFAVYSIVDKLVNAMFPTLDALRDSIEAVEDEVFYGKSSVAEKINGLRRKIADLKRIVSPLRRTMSEASLLLQRYGTKDIAAYLRDVLDHIDKVSESLEQDSETVEIYKDTNFIMSSDKTNKVLTVLTILFTLTLPAALVAAIYGMNVPLPLGNGQNPPDFFGPFTTFILLVVVMVVPTIFMAWYFRSKHWF